MLLLSCRLVAEMQLLNLNLPARVWLPFRGSHHHIVRVPPSAGVVLNSKDKVGFVLDARDRDTQSFKLIRLRFIFAC